MANALQMAIRRKRIDAAFRDATLADLRALDIAVDAETDGRAWSDTLATSTRWQLTTYDAAYLDLAQRKGLPLATLDKELRNAASALGMRLLGS